MSQLLNVEWKMNVKWTYFKAKTMNIGTTQSFR